MKEYKGKLAIFLLALTLLLVCLPNLLGEAYAQPSLPRPKSYKFTNGKWFDGKSFRRQTFYSVNGFLSRKKPAQIDEVVDLENSYVIPPFAEAHSHKLDTQSELDGQRRQFIKEGIMYVMVLNNYASNAVVNRQVFNKPNTLDVLYANGGITCTGQPRRSLTKEARRASPNGGCRKIQRLFKLVGKRSETHTGFSIPSKTLIKIGTPTSLLNLTSLKFICLT